MPASRAVAATLAVAAGAAALSGCGAYGARLRQQEAVAIFSASATPAEHLAARAACSRIPNVVVEPLSRSKTLASRLYDVRFRIDNASVAQLSQLENCLRHQPGVVGVEIPENM